MTSTSDRAAGRRRGRPRRALRRLTGLLATHGHLLLPAAAAILTLSSTHILLGPVLNRSGDNMYHLLNEYAIAHAIEAGDDPFGPLGMEFGQPVLRFYQALFYLENVGLHFLLGTDLKTLHNVAIVVFFALSPFGYLYFLRKLGLGRWAAGIGSYLSMISVAAFGNSFEAYHQAGIVTQSMGGLFFPWFMGSFIGMLRGENRASSTAFLFAVAFLSHAIMSVFAAFAGALYFLVAPVPLGWRTLKRLGAFAALGLALVAFWVLPFIAHTYEMRPVPDSIVRGRGVHWFTSVSKSELAMVLTSGRLLDDPPRMGKERNADDKFMDKISIIGTLKTRPPVLTVLAGLGALCALIGWRRTSRRFLIAGFAFSLMLFAGPDDFRWLHHLPFMKQIQTFRCTYLVELFAFGLAAVGVETALRQLWDLARTRRPFLRRPLVAMWILVFAAGSVWVGSEILLLGRKHLVIRDPARLDRMVDACGSLPDRGYPFRIEVKYPGRVKIRHAWLVAHGYRAYCTHWKGTGPTAAYHLCTSLGGMKDNGDLYALAGIRWASGRKKIEPLAEAVDGDGDPLLERWPNGESRIEGQTNEWHYLLDTGRDHFLRPLPGWPLPVVCTNGQWIWVAKSWTHRYRRRISDEDAAIAMRVRAGALEESGLAGAAKALFYFDHSGLERDLPALRRFAEAGGLVISPVEIPGVPTVRPGARAPWHLLPGEAVGSKRGRGEKLREEENPVFDVADVEMRERWGRSSQHYEFDVDLLEPLVAVLPMERAPGWHATLDGQPHPSFSAGPDLIGVRLPAGAHRVGFHWRMPGADRAALVATLLALALVLGVWARAAAGRLRGRGGAW